MGKGSRGSKGGKVRGGSKKRMSLTRPQPVDGYGSMQVHNHEAKQTIFAINHWREGGSADLGIGNRPRDNPDWTFSGSAGTYSYKRLRVLVHLK